MKTPSLINTLLCLALTGQVFGAKVIPNYAFANLVLGQEDFVSNSTLPQSSFSSRRPEGVVIDPITRKVFVAEYDNDRILRYPNVASLTNGAGAEAVFGQPNFGGPIVNTPLDLTLNGPIGLHFDRLGRLWVADSNNNRVLMYEAASFRDSQPKPDRVFGQPDFVTVSSGTTAEKISGPYGVFVDGEDRLWVADTSNNRVLFFDEISSNNNGAEADGVLGQAGFLSSTSGTTNSKMNFPESVVVSPDMTLFVADSSNNRVLRFNNAADIGNGPPASAVLGQPDFLTSTPGTSATTMRFPTAVSLDSSDSLWVTDYSNRRLIRFDLASTKPNGAAATGILGQPDFLTSAAAVTISSRGHIQSYGKAFIDATGSLWIPDTENNRVLRFPPDVTKPLLVVTTNVPKTVSKKKLTIKGTASDQFGISKVQYRLGNGPLKTATGTTSWQFTVNLAAGKNKITIFAVDSVGNVSLNKVIKVKRVATNAPALVLTSGD